MPRASNNLITRGNRYSFRIRVPQDLVEPIGKNEIKIALGNFRRVRSNEPSSIRAQ
ncbi:DUF6538 domain-containing protein [uncultured Cohaesibacter sp.]|uniref:DUF6538 domain-containing protein n=1 Tax=uncultured Cohaesibacter sp. TaxID=1002546 RepID=UPI0037491655